MTLFLLAMHVRHVVSHLSPFCSHFFKGNTRSFLNSLHLHFLVQHLEEKNPFIPSQGFNHFSFMLVILALLPLKETKKIKPWQPKENFHHYYTVANHYFLCKVSLSKLFQKCKMSLRRNFVVESANPSVDCSQ